MSDVQVLRELLERVEKTTGPDKGLDHDLSRLGDERTVIPFYTGSIDMALSLVEVLLPGAEWAASNMNKFHRRNQAAVNAGFGGAHGDGATMPLAILSALLRALISQHEQEGRV